MGKRFAILICVAATVAVALPSQVSAGDQKTAEINASRVGECTIAVTYEWSKFKKVGSASITYNGFLFVFPEQVEEPAKNSGTLSANFSIGSGGTYEFEGALLDKKGDPIASSIRSDDVEIDVCT